MSLYVREVANPELFSVAPHHDAKSVLGHLRALGISGAPVVDEDGFALGVVTMSDVVGVPDETRIDAIMSSPPIVVDSEATVELAATLMSEAGFHHLVVVDRHARTTGLVSSVDLMRALVGLPPRFPSAFPHFDKDTGASWTDPATLTLDHILESAPNGPGVIALIRGGRGVPEAIVWCEHTSDIGARLIDILSTPQPQPIRAIIEGNHLRFRAAVVPEVGRRLEVLQALEEGQWQDSPSRSS